MLPLESVKQEIRAAISAQRYRDAMRPFQTGSNAELNDAYFGPGKSPAKPPAGSRAGKPTQEQDDDPD